MERWVKEQRDARMKEFTEKLAEMEKKREAEREEGVNKIIQKLGLEKILKRYQQSMEHSKDHKAPYDAWEDTEDTSRLWGLISKNQLQSFKDWLEADPSVAFLRSKDGRGPMWWAYEFRREEFKLILRDQGVPETDIDGSGLTPQDL